jgi:hypothetical protein
MTLIKSIYKRAQAKLKSVSFENINEKQVEAQNAKVNTSLSLSVG